MTWMDTRIKVGIVGAGHMGQYHVNVASAIPAYEVCGVFDTDLEKGREIGERFGLPYYLSFQELLRDIDALVVAVPTALHYEIAKEALGAGKHVLVEKPMAANVEQARELVTLAEERNLIFQVGHVERFNGAVLELGKIVQNPFLIEARRLAPFDMRIQDVGVVLDLMIHDIDIILNLVKSEVISVFARGRPCFSVYEDIATATLQFASGCIANLVASRATQDKIRRLNITQENAYIVLDFATQDIDIHRRSSSAYLMTREELKYKQEAFVERIAVHRDNPLKQEHEHFLACIRGTQSPIVSGREELSTLQIANDIVDQVKKELSPSFV